MKQNEIIKVEKTSMYSGCPGFKASVRDCKNPDPSPNHCVRDCGNNKKVLAKIAGITPTMFTLKGRWACLCLH